MAPTAEPSKLVVREKMPTRVQLGNAKKTLNAYSISQHEEYLLLEVGAFREPFSLGCLFYNSILEQLRSAVPAMWVEIQSRKSMGGGRKKDLRLAPSEPVVIAGDYLAFDLPSKSDLDEAFEAFWRRKAIRFYGWQDLPFSRKLQSMPILYPNEKLEDFHRFFPELLRFCAERNLWGGFLRVVSEKSDFDLLNAAVQQASRLFSEPLTLERSVFSEF
jgi:hypothetical protein